MSSSREGGGKGISYTGSRRTVPSHGFRSIKNKSTTREGKMRFQKIQSMAKGMGINTFGMKKTDIIQFIQRKENNIDCYGTKRVAHCEEPECLWRSDCISLNNHGKVK
jgi:hypothetical protein